MYAQPVLAQKGVRKKYPFGTIQNIFVRNKFSEEHLKDHVTISFFDILLVEIMCVLCMLLCLVHVSFGMFGTFKRCGNVWNCVWSQHRIQPALASSSIGAR